MAGDWVAPVLLTVLRLNGVAAFILGMRGIINSRMRNRRWLAVGAMGLTVLFLSLIMVLLIRSLSEPEAGFLAMKYLMILPSMIGMIGVIWTLC